MIFIVASRTVKNIQLNTDIIISELAKRHGLILKNIFYRNIKFLYLFQQQILKVNCVLLCQKKVL